VEKLFELARELHGLSVFLRHMVLQISSNIDAVNIHSLALNQDALMLCPLISFYILFAAILSSLKKRVWYTISLHLRVTFV
jgi:hypothetical protein